MNQQTLSLPQIPSWIVWVQGICFSILYAIWVLPETILVRHVCLIVGALASLWVIYQYRKSFFQKKIYSSLANSRSLCMGELSPLFPCKRFCCAV
jgi:uncharacterized membrane protein YqjE